MDTHLPTRLGSAINGLFLVCVLFFAIAIAHNHAQLVFHEFPLDYNEGGLLVFTDTLAHGGNPFSLESQPARISLYPVLYNMLVAPLTHVFGNTFELHRVFSGIFLLGCCAMGYYLCRRASGTRTDSFIAAALLYAALLYYSTPIAGPNTTGLFLFLLTITVPWAHGFSTRSLAVTIALGILAFYTKQYFVAALGYVALYLFIAESKKLAIYFSLAALAAFSAVLALVLYTSPYYLDDTFFAVQSSAALVSSNAIVIVQFKEYFQIYLPLLIILAIATVHSIRSSQSASTQPGQQLRKSGFVNVFDFDKPLLLRKPNYVWVCLACSMIIIGLVLGKNRGNHLTYLFQLISPFLLVGTLALISDMPKWRWPFRALIVLTLYNSYFMLPNDFSVKEGNWRKIRKEISQAEDIYLSTLFFQEALDKGTTLYNTGATRYFVMASYKPAFFVRSNPEHRVPQIWERYVNLIQDKIRKQEFDLLLIDNWLKLPKSMLDTGSNTQTDTDTLLNTYYTQTAKLTLPLLKRPGGGSYKVQIWKPKTDIRNTIK